MKIVAAFALTAVLASCASVPTPLRGQYSMLSPTQAARSQTAGEVVRWGGEIVAVHPDAQRSCFEIVGLPLDASSRPRQVDSSIGRFLACRTGFYEPQVFGEGREITVSGRIEGFETRKVGSFDYLYPRVSADVIYLWPERVQRVHVPGPMFYGRFGYGPFGYHPWWW